MERPTPEIIEWTRLLMAQYKEIYPHDWMNRVAEMWDYINEGLHILKLC